MSPYFNKILMNAEQIVWRYVKASAKIDYFFIVELNFTSLVIAVIGLVFI